MKEIGGYIELDTYHLPLLHCDAIALNCGRNALAYILKARNIKRLWIPRLICDSIIKVCEREDVSYAFYRIDTNFLPNGDVGLKEGEWIFLVNYYSQIDNDLLTVFINKYRRVIVDNTHSYFQIPLPGVDTIYSCRKYFGVSDGAFLYTDIILCEDLQQDESFSRVKFLLGRYERTASEFYSDYVANNELFNTEPIKKMSKLTRNLLCGIDYERVKKKRIENYIYLHKKLGSINLLNLSNRPGTYMYPLLIENGARIRKKLQLKKIYIPTLWPEVLDYCRETEQEYQMANNILPLPIDQRYCKSDLDYLYGEIVNV